MTVDVTQRIYLVWVTNVDVEYLKRLGAPTIELESRDSKLLFIRVHGDGMAPRKACQVCGSRQWHRAAGTGYVTCNEGHVLEVR